MQFLPCRWCLVHYRCSYVVLFQAGCQDGGVSALLFVATEIGVLQLVSSRVAGGSMAGAVQVLALSDDEDNLSCIWSTPRSQAQPRPRPGIGQCPPITPGTTFVFFLKVFQFFFVQF